MKKGFFSSFLLILTILVSGCGGVSEPSDFPSVYPCQIKVTNGGSPLSDIAVNLFPDKPLSNIIVEGKTDANGVAIIRTKHGDYSKAGAPSGDYVIRFVESIDTGMPQLTSEQEYAMTQQQRDARNKEMEDKKNAMRTISKQLESPATSPVKLSVSSAEASLEVDVAKYKK